MPKVTIRVDRDPAKQPDWARNFLLDAGLDGQDAPMYRAMLRYIDNVEAIVKHLKANVHIAFGPFNPPVTLAMNIRSWIFTWATEAEYTMFLLKWS